MVFTMDSFMAHDQLVAQNIQPGGVQCIKSYKAGHIFFRVPKKQNTRKTNHVCQSPHQARYE